METQKEEDPVFLDRASRATRGKRMTKLVDEEVEEDDQFWNQDALKEEEDDTNYQEETEVADVFDSDFDEDEPEPDEEGEKEPDDRTRPKKRLMYPGKQLPKKKKKKKKILSSLDGAIQDEPAPEQSTLPEDHDTHEDIEVEKTVRKSTRTSVIVRQAERDAIRAALQATMKPIKRRKEGEEKRMTQEEMLLEAAQTEIMNLRNLERVLAREEEVKKRAIVHKAVYTGPQIRYYSRDGCSYLEYNNGASFESQISTTPTPYPDKALCAVTGLPANIGRKKFIRKYTFYKCGTGPEMKYRDPKTGLPYATKEAFRIIREKFSNDNSSINEKNSMGIAHDLTCEPGFTKKKKRSVNPNSRVMSYSYDRFFARFRRIPALEMEDSE